jgi:hypothetical protein
VESERLQRLTKNRELTKENKTKQKKRNAKAVAK